MYHYADNYTNTIRREMMYKNSIKSSRTDLKKSGLFKCELDFIYSAIYFVTPIKMHKWIYFFSSRKIQTPSKTMVSLIDEKIHTIFRELVERKPSFLNQFEILFGFLRFKSVLLGLRNA